nr:PREDICTED: uncharacterized protein LOC109041092 [Bemisia tabaci]
MISSVCSTAFSLLSIVALATLAPTSQSYDELLDAFINVETNRKAAIKGAVEVASDRKNNETLDLLHGVVAEADLVLENIRRYFDAGKVMFDLNKGKLNLAEADVISKTRLMQEKSYLKDQLHQLAATLKTLKAQMKDLPRDLMNILQPVIRSIEQSKDAFVPLTRQFRVCLDEIKPTLIVPGHKTTS